VVRDDESMARLRCHDMDGAGRLELRGLEDMRMQPNIYVLSDDNAQALLPILADVGRIVEDSRRSRLGNLPTIGKRLPAKTTDPRGRAIEWSW
jgi:hypothetical protein